MPFFHLWLRSKKVEQGFALVIALMLGLCLTVIGLTLVLRGINHKEFVTMQQQTADAQSAAEIGLTRFRGQLLLNLFLVTQNQSNWMTIINGSTPEGLGKQKLLKKCDSAQEWQQKVDTLSPYATGDFQPINGDDVGFRLKKYTYFPQKKKGQILVEGFAKDARAYIRAEFPVNFRELPFPGLWVRSQGAGMGTGRNYINANLWANNCQYPIDTVYSDDSKFKAEHTALDMPKLPDLNAIANRIPDNQKHLTITDLTIIDSTTNLTFPRPGDKVTWQFNGVSTYEYVVNSIDLSNQSITVNTQGDGSVKVVFYALGSIKGEIKHTCGSIPCKASDFMVLGYAKNGVITLGVYSPPAPQICLRGSGDLPMFVFAPYYAMGMQKTGTSPLFNFQGAAWVDRWDVGGLCGDNRNLIKLVSSIQWNDLPKDFWLDNPYPSMGNLSAWSNVSAESTPSIPINNTPRGDMLAPRGAMIAPNGSDLAPYQLLPSSSSSLLP